MTPLPPGWVLDRPGLTVEGLYLHWHGNTSKAGTVMSSSLPSQHPMFNKRLNEWTKVSSPIHSSCFLSMTLL